MHKISILNVISNRLQEQLRSSDDYHHISILLSDRVDVQGMDEDFYHQNTNLEDRVFTLITSLKDKAANSQQNLLTYLHQNQLVDQSSINPYWITNLVFIKAKKEAIAQLSHRDDIEWMDINAKLEVTDYEDVETMLPASPNGIEPGLEAINAPKMWDLGYTGYGMVTFVNDTGVDPNHPSYKLKYRGHYVEPAQAWFEYNSSNTHPFDCSDHGTHTLGTMIGLDRNTYDTIGVAFNALWMGSPILCGIHTEDNVAAFQYALDPDDNAGTVDDMPDAINNSWHDSSLDTLDCFSIYVPILDALEASGIAVVFSAGNDGPDPSTISEPHNINTSLVNSFTVGALNGNIPSLEIAGFSSRGPSQCDATGSLLIKPEVSAPGVDVRSSLPNGGYGLKSGTSMASPHVVGAILLLKEAFPYLTGTELKLSLYYTCTDLGEPGEDNTYGMGIIDVFAAYNYLIGQGHVPEDPSVTYDAMLIDAQAPNFICDSELNATIEIENAGTVVLTSLDIYYETSGPTNNSDTYSWTGNLAPGEKTTIALPTQNIGSGNYELLVELRLPNGEVDERELNNVFRHQFISFEQLNLSAEMDQINDNAACQGSSALLRADYEGEGIVEWYDSFLDGNLLGSGNAYETGTINSNTTYYTDVRFHNSVGIVNPNPADLEFTEEIGGGILFDSYIPFVLKSVTIHPQSTGVCIINLKRKSGSGIAGKTVLLTQAVEQVVDLNFNVPAGVDLELIISDGVSLSHSSDGINYPYSVSTVMNIKSSTDEVNPEDFYYYFYDWEIDYYKNCDRVPVTVEVEPTSTVPTAAFNASADSIDLALNGLVNFTDSSFEAVQWQWNFGDGNGSDLQSPAHTFTQPGNYIVSLTVLNADGCSDTAIKSIIVSQTVSAKSPIFSEDQISVFPVPTNEQLNLHFDLNQSLLLDVKLFDILGHEILSLPQKSFFQDTQTMNLSKLPEGVYFIIFKSENQRVIKKVVKSKN